MTESIQNPVKLTNLRTELSRLETLVAAGGFRDADGDWNTLGETALAQKTAEISRIRTTIAEEEKKPTS